MSSDSLPQPNPNPVRENLREELKYSSDRDVAVLVFYGNAIPFLRRELAAAREERTGAAAESDLIARLRSDMIAQFRAQIDGPGEGHFIDCQVWKRERLATHGVLEPDGAEAIAALREPSGDGFFWLVCCQGTEEGEFAPPVPYRVPLPD
jgi:hypothetical protein